MWSTSHASCDQLNNDTLTLCFWNQTAHTALTRAGVTLILMWDSVFTLTLGPHRARAGQRGHSENTAESRFDLPGALGFSLEQFITYTAVVTCVPSVLMT